LFFYFYTISLMNGVDRYWWQCGLIDGINRYKLFCIMNKLYTVPEPLRSHSVNAWPLKNNSALWWACCNTECVLRGHFFLGLKVYLTRAISNILQTFWRCHCWFRTYHSAAGSPAGAPLYFLLLFKAWIVGLGTMGNRLRTSTYRG
jgi:hypothetical protein